MVRESLSREVTFELFLMDLKVKRTQAMQGLRTRVFQTEGTVPCKGPVVESNSVCSRNRTLLTPPKKWAVAVKKGENRGSAFTSAPSSPGLPELRGSWCCQVVVREGRLEDTAGLLSPSRNCQEEQLSFGYLT